MHSRATDGMSASKCQGKWPDQTPDQALGLPEVLVAVSTSRLSCRRAGKTRTLMPVWDSSGESRFQERLEPTGLAVRPRGMKMKRWLSLLMRWNRHYQRLGLPEWEHPFVPSAQRRPEGHG